MCAQPSPGIAGASASDWAGTVRLAKRHVQRTLGVVRDRSVIEIMVLTLTFVVAFSIVGVGITVAIIEIRDPTVDTSRAGQALMSVITALLGALLGILAGRSDALRKDLSEHHEPKPDPDD